MVSCLVVFLIPVGWCCIVVLHQSIELDGENALRIRHGDVLFSCLDGYKILTHHTLSHILIRNANL